VLAEGGITRMMAVFSDIQSVEHLGSVRSIRPYYIDIALSYGAVTIHAGGSPDAYRRIAAEHIENLDGVNGVYPTTSAFYYDQTRRYSGYAQEHTLFTEGKNLSAYAEKQGYSLTVEKDYDTGLRFCADATPEAGQSAQKVHIAFIGSDSGKCTDLVYNEETGVYTAVQWFPTRSGVYQADYVDGNDNAALHFSNILAITAETKVLDSSGRLQVGFIGQGSGFFACGGKYEEISWERSSVEEPFHYYRADGSELQLSAGPTYIGVLSSSGMTSTISFS